MAGQGQAAKAFEGGGATRARPTRSATIRVASGQSTRADGSGQRVDPHQSGWLRRIFQAIIGPGTVSINRQTPPGRRSRRSALAEHR